MKIKKYLVAFIYLIFLLLKDIAVYFLGKSNFFYNIKV